LVQWFQNGFLKQELELSKQKMELFLPFLVIWSKNFFNKTIPIWLNDSKNGFQNQEMESSKQEMELFIPFPKTSLTEVFPFGQTIPN
jgi:hypothetical protein